MSYVDTIGRYGQGNIDLNNRIVVHNPDGSFSTELSFSVEIDNDIVLLPSIVYGRIVSDDDAIDHYIQTGEHLGIFQTVSAMEEYAQRLHERQERYYTVGVFNGKLIELKIGGNWTELPMRFIKAESYQVTPEQRMESAAARSASGILKRATCSHTASKIEFNTVPMTNADVKEINVLLNNAYIDALQKKLKLKYYNPTEDDYKEGEFYVPDIEFPIMRVDRDNNIIHYNSIRYAFIEY